MYRRVLVTLDQSSLAELALPHALAIAQAFSAEIELLTVIPYHAFAEGAVGGGMFPGTEPLGPVMVDDEALGRAAREYLEQIAARVRADGVPCECAVVQGDVAESVLEFARGSECDLIAMCTHGRSGLGRWVYGSVADRVLRHATVPVLLVRAGDGV
jgi:nucleotide-binding universal stress UspA family protein